MSWKREKNIVEWGHPFALNRCPRSSSIADQYTAWSGWVWSAAGGARWGAGPHAAWRTENRRHAPPCPRSRHGRESGVSSESSARRAPADRPIGAGSRPTGAVGSAARRCRNASAPPNGNRLGPARRVRRGTAVPYAATIKARKLRTKRKNNIEATEKQFRKILPI